MSFTATFTTFILYAVIVLFFQVIGYKIGNNSPSVCCAVFYVSIELFKPRFRCLIVFIPHICITCFLFVNRHIVSFNPLTQRVIKRFISKFCIKWLLYFQPSIVHLFLTCIGVSVFCIFYPNKFKHFQKVSFSAI